MKVYHGHLIMFLNSMDEICVFSERVEVVHYYNYDTEKKSSASSLSDPQSHIESVLIILRYKSKFKLVQRFRKRACKTGNCLLP